MSNLIPDISMNLMAIPMLGSINKVVKALITIYNCISETLDDDYGLLQVIS
jgi:hypothetical protein